MAAGKVRASAPTVPEDQPLLPCATINEDPSETPHEKPAEGVEEAADKPADGQDDSASKKQQEEQQQAVMTLIQGVAIGQAKGGCWSIKQASILNSAVKQLTGSGEPSVLPAFDPSETPAEGLPPSAALRHLLDPSRRVRSGQGGFQPGAGSHSGLGDRCAHIGEQVCLSKFACGYHHVFL